MINCPIIGKELDSEDCVATIQAVKSGKKDEFVQGRVKRINGWKFICKNCKNHV